VDPEGDHDAAEPDAAQQWLKLSVRPFLEMHVSIDRRGDAESVGRANRGQRVRRHEPVPTTLPQNSSYLPEMGFDILLM
jgi:hypothetical protein